MSKRITKEYLKSRKWFMNRDNPEMTAIYNFSAKKSNSSTKV